MEAFDYENALRNAHRDLAYYKQGDVPYYMLYTPYDENTCPECRRLSGIPFPVSEAKIGVNFPPFCPECRGSTVPVYPASLEYYLTVTTAVRSVNGKIVHIPCCMSYDEWKSWKDSGEPFISFVRFYRDYLHKYPFLLQDDKQTDIRSSKKELSAHLKAKKYFLSVLGVVSSLASIFPIALVFVSFDGRFENAVAARNVGCAAFVSLLATSVYFFKSARRITPPKETDVFSEQAETPVN